ncbi:sulfatase-like hydrolase/transferase [Halorussus aquaticus]|uniref:Sulfatase-like hydrolase/transferase n=1 Tax=Halorussus aquaticus TaxID=2953748 RepID=A0ABD5Q5X0_9EURY|nr:sulfatase-like hydrolase/transferase [Halorussus aquaticus]
MSDAPNVIFLSADSLPQKSFSKQAKHIAEMTEGTVFTNAVATASDTNSAMPGLAAGVFSDTVPGWGLPDDGTAPRTVSRTLQSEGYDCGLWTDNFLFGEEYNYTDGFEFGNAGKPTWKKTAVNVIRDNFPDAAFRAAEVTYFRLFKPLLSAVRSTESFYLTAEELNQEALEWARTWDDGQHFLRVHYMDAHHPYEPPVEYVRDVVEETGFSRSELGKISRERIKTNGEDVTDAELDAIRSVFDASCRYLYDEVAELIADLVDCGAYRPSTDVLVFTADHGEALDPQKHRMMGHVPPAFWEDVVNVPLVVSVPKWSRDRVDRQVSLIDLVPTILRAVDIDPPESVEGRPAERPEDMVRETTTFVSEWRSDDGDAWRRYRGVRTEDAKVFGARLGDDDVCVSTVLDDSGETLSTISERQPSADLTDAHQKLLAEIEPRGGLLSEGTDKDFDADVEDHLRNLGYVE